MSKVIVKQKPQWFRELVLKVKAILDVERRMVIRAKHLIGKAILEARERAELEYGRITDFMKDLAKEVGYSWQELYACMKFAEKYPDLDSFLMSSENLSWMRIVHEMLYGERLESGEVLRLVECLACHESRALEETKPFRLCAKCVSEFQVWLAERE